MILASIILKTLGVIVAVIFLAGLILGLAARRR